MIEIIRISELKLEQASGVGRPDHLSAASGLVCIGGQAYVVADDELHLGLFDLGRNGPGRLLQLFPGELPDDNAERKALKPDLETLALLPPMSGYPHGALLALGSGSKKNRRKGVLLALDVGGTLGAAPQLIALDALYRALESKVDDLNIEGAFVNGDQLLLLQRGNKKSQRNALIALPLVEILPLLRDPAASIKVRKRDIIQFDLGKIGDVPLTFTDGAPLPNGDFLFSAVAENTDDSYADGVCLGAAIGVAAPDGAVKFLQPLLQPYKVEGISARVDGDGIQMLLVTDADDPTVPASLLSARISGYPF